MLGCYLTPYFAKILHTRKPTLYVDGFAGKGKFDDGKNGSPLIALECLSGALERYKGNHARPDVSVKFIELNHSDDLLNNLSDRHKQHSEVISGKFEEKIIPLLEFSAQKNKEQNVFLYIDPYGVKALNANLFDVLPSIFNSAELLINLNSWGFLRMVFALKKTKFRENIDELFKDLDEYDKSTTNSVDRANLIAGGDYWQDIVARYKREEIDCYQAEKEFASKYKFRLREKYKYVLDMPIRLKASNHPKYRMVYATNHPEGCLLMAENMASRTSFLIIDIQNAGQMSLFDKTADNKIISNEELIEKVRALIESTTEPIRLNDFLASFYNEYGVLCQSSRIRQNALKVLEESYFIDVIRIPALTPTGKASTFWSEGNGNTITIKKREL